MLLSILKYNNTGLLRSFSKAEAMAATGPYAIQIILIPSLLFLLLLLTLLYYYPLSNYQNNLTDMFIFSYPSTNINTSTSLVPQTKASYESQLLAIPVPSPSPSPPQPNTILSLVAPMGKHSRKRVSFAIV